MQPDLFWSNSAESFFDWIFSAAEMWLIDGYK